MTGKIVIEVTSKGVEAYGDMIPGQNIELRFLENAIASHGMEFPPRFARKTSEASHMPVVSQEHQQKSIHRSPWHPHVHGMPEA